MPLNNLTTHLKISPRKCPRCGLNLFLAEKKTELIEGQYSPVTTSLYKCSDKACQDDSEKKMAQRLKLVEEQESARKKRIENMRKNRTKKVSKKN